jgi:type II secretory pathway predicted ATPase ExeA
MEWNPKTIIEILTIVSIVGTGVKLYINLKRSIGDTENALKNKANKEDVIRIDSKLDNKADKDNINEIRLTLNNKANKDKIDEKINKIETTLIELVLQTTNMSGVLNDTAKKIDDNFKEINGKLEELVKEHNKLNNIVTRLEAQHEMNHKPKNSDN